MMKIQPQRPVRRNGEGAGRANLVWILLVMLGLVSCETLVNTIPESKLPKTESQLTLFSFISPQDTVIRVRVGQTRPVFSESPAATPDFEIVNGDTLYTSQDLVVGATVTISDGQATATIPYRPAERAYTLPTAQFPIRTGRTYTLTVTEGRRRAQATCTVPVDQVPVTGYTLDTVTTGVFGRRDTSLHLRFTWNDLTGTTNYYRVRAFELYEYSVVTINTDELFLVEKRRQERFYFSWSGTDGRPVFQSDANLDGTTFTSPQGEKRLENAQVFQQLSGNTVTPERGPKLLGLYLLLLNTDNHYYLYHRSLQQARRDNPFTEPALVYTNVQGGLGIFAGYNTSIRVVNP